MKNDNPAPKIEADKEELAKLRDELQLNEAQFRWLKRRVEALIDKAVVAELESILEKIPDGLSNRDGVRAVKGKEYTSGYYTALGQVRDEINLPLSKLKAIMEIKEWVN